MAFVKLDCGILDSTIWVDRDARELFITALLMAQPFVLESEVSAIEVDSLAKTGFAVPPGRYGLVNAAGIGIVRRACLPDADGLAALRRLCAPEADSRSLEYDGRRLARISGGFLVLNFAKYRDKDHTSAERSKRYRATKGKKKSRRSYPEAHEAATVARFGSGAITQDELDAAAADKAACDVGL